MNEWAKIEELTRMMCLVFLRQGAVQEAAACSPELERTADQWIREWCADGTNWLPPKDPELLRLLLARFRYLTAHAQAHTLRASPLPAATANLTMELYLIDVWHSQFRARWLSGEQGTAPRDN